MTAVPWRVPPSVRGLLERAPRDRAVVLFLRHSVRGELPIGEPGDLVPITEVGHRLALELGELLRGRLQTLQTSPILRCVQTAQALAEGAGFTPPVVANRMFGAPGVYVLDGQRAWDNWVRLGHEGVMQHLIDGTHALPGMARPDEAARLLVLSMLAEADDSPGLHVFVTHDSLVAATAARLLGKRLGPVDWPWYLEGAFFWRTSDGVHTAYRDNERHRVGALCALDELDVVEFARRELAATTGLDCPARFFLAGSAFKSLLTGRRPRDLDLWAPSEHDRALLIETLQARGATPAVGGAFGDAFTIAERLVEIPHKTEPHALSDRLQRFDIGLSAVGVEYRPGGEWSAVVHPLAHESVRRREVLLLKPLVNWPYALTTMERMRRYAEELSFGVPAEEEAELWRVFAAQDAATRAGMIARYRRTGTGAFGVVEEVARRFS